MTPTESIAKIESTVPESIEETMQEQPSTTVEISQDPEQAMMALMGFGGFDSTKGKHVEGADVTVGTVFRPGKRKHYRQYMNTRKGDEAVDRRR